MYHLFRRKKVVLINFVFGFCTFCILGFILCVIFWIINPQSALEIKLIKLEAQVESNETIATKLQNIKDNDLHEVQVRLNQIEDRQIKQLEVLARLEFILSK